MNLRIGWGQPPTGWGQPHLPGWAPLVDHGPLPLQAVRSVGRWFWPTAAVGGFLAVVVQVFDHDDPTPGLSHRGLLTVALAAAVVVLLTIHRRRGPGSLARAMTEYAVVALLAALLAAAGVGADQQPANRAASPEARPQAAAGDDQSALIRAGAKVVRAVAGAARGVAGAVRWLVGLWRQADHKTQSVKGEPMAAHALSAAPVLTSLWRSP